MAAKYLLPLMLPFVVAFAASALLQRPIRLLQKRLPRLPKKAVAAGTIAVFLATAGTAAVLIISALIRQMVDFAGEIPHMIENALLALSSEGQSHGQSVPAFLPEWLRERAAQLAQQLRSDLPGVLSSALQALSAPIISSVGAIGSLAMKLPSIIISILITVAAAFFIGTDFAGTVELLRRLCPTHLREKVSHIRRCSVSTVVQLLKTYAFLMLLTFTELAVGFCVMELLGERIDYIVPLALVISVVDILPVLGVGTVLLPWAGYCLLSGETYRAIMLFTLYAVILVVRNFLEPKLVGERFGLHPAATLLAIYTGGRLFGFIGILLLPLTAIVLMRLHSMETEANNNTAKD